MEEKLLKWEEEGRKMILDGNVFSVWESYCTPPEGKSTDCKSSCEPSVFSVIEAKDWAMVIPVIESPEGRKFVMVWQWRHGSKCLSLEFPGGVFEPGENPEEAAARELYEETGYRPCKIKKLGDFSPNPAIMTNRIHFFLAEDLLGEGIQHLDKDEYVEVEIVPADEVIQGLGKPPYVHALIGTALALYLNR